MLRHQLAEQRPDVVAIREELLEDGLLAPEEVVGWVEERLAAGEPVEHVTVNQNGDEIRRERPALHYAAPGDEYERLSASVASLEGLRQTSESLAKAYNWQLAQATIWIITGVAPAVAPIRVTTRRQFPLGSRIVLDVDPDQDPEAVAEAYKLSRARSFAGNRLKAGKEATLAEFVLERFNGDWNRVWLDWNGEHRPWKYKTRQSFITGAETAIEKIDRSPG